MRSTLILTVAAAGWLAACAPARTDDPADVASGAGIGSEGSSAIVVEGAWARPASAGSATAVYFTAQNAGRQADRLLGVRSSAGVAEIHATIHADGIARMRHVPDGVPIDAGGRLAFEPLAYHVMLSDLAADLVEGDSIEVTLEFEQSGPIEVRAAISPNAPNAPNAP